MKHWTTPINAFQTRPWVVILMAAVGLCLLLAACGETTQERCNRLDNAGNQYFAAGQYQKALNAWSELLAIKPDAAPAVHQKTGDCYTKLAQYNQALRSYNQAVQLQPENWQLWYKISRLQLFLMNLSTAEKIWKKVNPHLNDCCTLIFHGDLLLLQKKYRRAEQEYRQTNAQEPQNQTAMIRLATNLVAQGKNDEAEKIFNALSALPPQSAEVLLQMGNFCSLKGDNQKAQRLIQKALEMEPDNCDLKMKLVNLYLETGRYEQAVSTLQNFIQQAPGSRYAKKLLVESLLLAKRCQEAGQQLDNLTSIEKKDWELQLLRSKYYLNTRQFQKAITQLQAILDKEPNIPLAHYFMGIAYLAAGMNNLGQQSLTKCLVLSPDFTKAELLLADTYYKNKDYTLALQYTERIRKREPENYRSHLIAGNIHLARKEYQAALEDYQDAFYLFPGNPMSSYYTALCSYLSGNTTNALSSLQTLLQNDPMPTDAALQYARISCQANKSQQAIECMRQAIKKKPQNPYLHHILGEIYLAAGDNENAVQEFTRALSLKPNMKASYLKLFDLCGSDKNRLEKLLNDAITSNKNFTEATTRLAKLYCQKGLHEKAIATLEHARRANPRDPCLANNLAWLYAEYQPENIDQAINLAQAAYEKLPDNPAAVDTLGWIYFKKGMYTRAAWLLKQAETFAPSNPIIAEHLAKLQSVFEQPL